MRFQDHQTQDGSCRKRSRLDHREAHHENAADQESVLADHQIYECRSIPECKRHWRHAGGYKSIKYGGSHHPENEGGAEWKKCKGSNDEEEGRGIGERHSTTDLGDRVLDCPVNGNVIRQFGMTTKDETSRRPEIQEVDAGWVEPVRQGRPQTNQHE